MELLTQGNSVLLQRQDGVPNSTRSYRLVPETFKIMAVALGVLAVLTWLVIVSDKVEMPVLADPTSLYGP